ncbi:LysR family transcriptional regulator [Acinetobacter sp. MB5]|uniref:LysR family transcriptional regulator n=1 Tax=Acinetobacter sp. MB5 TaxID=2069438 RepID=UPI000DD00763|nr:LysR family transcriptional regulator [Acinetobacter sp. MB5]
MINIDLSDIKAFVVTADLGSLSAAAQHLGHLQSNITVKIKKIENHYKYPLFVRQPKGVELTPKGQLVYAQYKKLLAIWEETDQKVAAQNNILKFGINSTMRGNHFAEMIHDLSQQYPKLSLTFKTGITKSLESQVVEGVLDFAYIFGDSLNKQLDYLDNGEEELVLIGKDLTTDLSENLSQHKILCLSEDCCYMTILDRLYQSVTLPPTEKIYISELEDLICFSQLGLGIALIARSLIHKYKVQHYVEIPESFRVMKGYIISRKHHKFSPIEKDCIALSQASTLL